MQTSNFEDSYSFSLQQMRKTFKVYDFGEDVTIHGIQIFQKSVDYHYNEVFDILVATTK